MFAYELVAWSEIDKYAIQAHNALYPQWSDRNLGDITKVDWEKVPDFDLLTYSSPCQDFSNAGLQKGGEEGSGTRSSLLWEIRKAVLTKKPKFLLLENVKALTSKKFFPLFQKWMDELESYGYTNYWQVLNAKDYGVPQNRERVFLVSILNDNSIVYCDPPYANTNPYGLNRSKFDNDTFWEWARHCKQPVFISEYEAPKDFICIAEIPTTSKIGAKTSKLVTEKIFIRASDSEYLSSLFL